MNNCPIGIFDSGVGGLSVFSELVKLMENENYIYFGDTANLPYGNKTKEQLVEITSNIFNFFAQKNVKAVVMACNTTSAVTYDILKDKYKFKIYPVVQSVSKQIALQNHDRIGVFATSATINSHAYKRELQKYNPDCKVFEQACPAWVSIAENGLFTETKSVNIIKSDLDRMLENNVEKIILGCTHYPYLLNVLTRFAPEDIFINPARYFAEHILDDLEKSNMLNAERNKEPQFYISANAEKFKKSAKMFYSVENVHEIRLELSKL